MRLCVAVVTTTLLTACTPSRPSADTALALARDSGPLMALCSGKQSIDATKWPASFKISGVTSAYMGQDGLYLETDHFYVQETGVFIPCDLSKFSSESATGGDPSYLKVADGVFTYYVAG